MNAGPPPKALHWRRKSKSGMQPGARPASGFACRGSGEMRARRPGCIGAKPTRPVDRAGPPCSMSRMDI
jgi:hypothetical protein